MKKVLATILSLVMVFTILPVAVVNVSAANAYVINGVTVRYTDFSSSPNECWAYANNVYKKIWGRNFNSTFSDDNYLRNLSDSQLTLNATNLKNYVSGAALGSSLRICNSEYLHGSDGWGHSQIIVQKDSNGFTVFQGGLSASPYKNETYYTWSGYCNTSWLGGTYKYIKYIKWPGAPAYSSTPTNKAPNATLDSVTGQTGAVQVRGWAYDPDNTSIALSVHVYIGSKSYAITANKSRPDVNKVYGCGDNHGFDATVYTDLSGSQTVKVFAIGINKSGGPDNNNPQFGTKTVTITKDSTKPTISDVKVTNVSAEGYTVSCTVKDNVAVDRVQFPTWTSYAGQDDLLKDWQTNAKAKGTISGNTVTFNVKNTDHNGEIGTYITDIYAYDKAGNVASIRSSVTLRDYISLAGQKEYNGRKYELYNAATNCDSAKEYAEEKGGHLVTITSAAENNAVADLIKQYGTKNLYWMGAFDKNKNKSFEWVTGEAFSYTNWAVNDPSVNDNTQQYLQISSMDNPGSTLRIR